MATSPSNANAEPAKIEQIITEFFTKSLHIILESRSPYVSSRNYYSGDPSTSPPSSSSSTSSIRPRDKWFNLALRECPAALENLEMWRQSNFEPLVVDIVLINRPLDSDQAYPPPDGCLLRNLSAKDRYQNYWCFGQDEFVPESKSEKIIERWILQYESRKNSGNARDSISGSKRSSGGSSHSSDILAAFKKTYRRSIVLLRSLYVTVRLLPAHKVFRDLNCSSQIRPFSLAHKISSFVEPFTRREDAEMNQFAFVPVDTPCGRLCLSVSYLPTLEDVSSEPSTPLSTQFITDYVGSPLADPLKRFDYLPSTEPTPAYMPFTRRHSWSNDHGVRPSLYPPPSPTHSDSRALHSNWNLHLLPPRSDQNVTNSPAETSFPRITSLGHDEYWPSPPFSPLPSPSPPMHPMSGTSSSALLRTESAPVRIPPAERNGGLLIHALPPSPSPKSARPRSSSQTDCAKAQGSATSPPPESRFRTKQVSLPGEFLTGKTLQKVLPLGIDDVANFHGAKIPSCASPRASFSRSASRRSFLDEFDDSEFVCPFAFGDDDLRIGLSDGKGHEGSSTGGFLPMRKSQDAAVGALVQMLKTAPPLCQDFSNSVKFSQVSKAGNWNEGIRPQDIEPRLDECPHTTPSIGISGSWLLRSRTTADALEELKGYRVMKDSLTREGESHSLDVKNAAKSEAGSSSEL